MSPDALRVPGVYMLVARLAGPVALAIRGRLLRLPRGVYVYTGSAMGPGGLAARLRRHLCGRRRRLWWHIDRLLTAPGAEPLAAVACPTGVRAAETLLAHLAYSCRLLEPVPGFGGSDDPHGLSHLHRCGGGALHCLRAAHGLASGLPCLPAVVEPRQLCRETHK